jgi:hypothetical protein
MKIYYFSINLSFMQTDTAGYCKCSVQLKTTFVFQSQVLYTSALNLYENEITNSRAGCVVDGEFKGFATQSGEFIGYPSHD